MAGSVNPVIAEDILVEIRESSAPSFFREYAVAEPSNVRKEMYRRMSVEEKSRVVISAKNGKLLVSAKVTPKNKEIVTRLRSLLVETLQHIDDENLYDRIFQEVYEQGKS